MGQQTMAKKRRQLELGIYRDRYILKPIFDSQNKELLMCLQLSKTDDFAKRQALPHPTSKTGSTPSQQQVMNEFNEFDHTKLDILTCILRQRIEAQIYRIDSAERKDRVFKLMKSCFEIMKQKTHIHLIRTMRVELPKLFDFEELNIYFKNLFCKYHQHFN
jgi:hypothetical protein